MSNKLCKLVLLLFTLVFSGCISSSKKLEMDIAATNTSLDKVLAPASLPRVTKSSSHIVQAIFEMPSVSRSMVAAQAAQSRVSIAESAKKLTVNASSSTGLNSETNDGSHGAFLLTVSAQKLLEDNGQADRSIFLSELVAEAAILEAQIDIDQTLQKILDAYTSQNTASKVDGIIDHYVGMFNEREDLVKKAVEVGVLSNSDYLELQSLKNETLSEQAQALLRFKSSKSFLKTSFKTHFDAAVVELASKYSLLEVPPLLFEKAYTKEILDIKSVQIKTEIEIEETLKKPVVNWQTSVSSPKSRGAGSTLFTGVTIGMPLKDGGKAVAKIDALLKELDVIILEIDTLKQKTLLANERLTDFLDYYQKQNSLLLERKKISEERIVELELKIRAGRSDISVLAKQFLTNARTEIALEQLNYERSSEILAAVAVTGQTCELLSICDAIIAGIAK